MKSIFLIFVILIFTTSCSQIEFVQNGAKPFKISAESGSEKIIEVHGEVPFYFWGLVPKKHVVDLETELFEKGAHFPSMVKVGRESTFRSTFFTIMTLGLYDPEAYVISVYSREKEYE